MGRQLGQVRFGVSLAWACDETALRCYWSVCLSPQTSDEDVNVKLLCAWRVDSAEEEAERTLQNSRRIKHNADGCWKAEEGSEIEVI
jgi:hypothetical protein